MKTYTEADLAAAWEDGFNWCYDDGGLAQNPYRKEEIAAKLHLDDDSEIHLRAGLGVHATGGGCE